MKKLLVMMLMVLGLSVGGFAKGNAFTKGNTEPTESKERVLYLGLINSLTRECASMGRPTYIACRGFLTKYENHFFKIRGMDVEDSDILDLKDDDLAYIYQALSRFVFSQFYNLNPNIDDLTEQEMAEYNRVIEDTDVCLATDAAEKKFLRCK